jgi:phage tail sheath protein FI
MPEYLAPGVYVEEIDTGNKPIEGVSTSTSGVLGVTECGPVNVPTLVTSFGQFTRWFGGYLNIAAFSNDNGQHCYLPHAVEGFFTNGGKRVFVVRVLDAAASLAATQLFDRGTPGAADAVATQLLHRVSPGSTTIYVLDNAAGLAKLPTVRIGEGSEAEYLRVSAAPNTANRNDVALRLPVTSAHAATAAATPTSVDQIPVPQVPTPTVTTTLLDGAGPGNTQFRVKNAAGFAAGNLVRIGGADPDYEYMFVGAVNPATSIITLRRPLQLLHPIDDAITVISAAPVTAGIDLATAMSAGDSVLFVPVANHGALITPGDFIRINDGDNSEIRQIGELGTVTLTEGAYADYPAGALVEAVNPANDAGADRFLTAAAPAGSVVIAVDSREKLQVGDVVRIGLVTDPDREFVVIRSLPNPGPAPNAGNVVVNAPIQRAHAAATVVHRQTMPIPRTTPPPTALMLTAPRGSSVLTLSGSHDFAKDAVVRVTTSSGTPYYHRAAADAVPLTPVPVTLEAPLDLAHPAGAVVVNRNVLLLVQALDPGAWGNRLRATVQDQDPPVLRTRILKTKGAVQGIVDNTHIRLESTSSVELGTILQRTGADGQPIGTPFKVVGIDRQANNLITLDFANPIPAGTAEGDSIRSLEFQLNVYLLRQPDAAVPLRSETVQDSEIFRYLSMDPRHSRYVHKVIGTTWTPGPAQEDDDGNPLRVDDRRSEGESRYARVRDLAQDLSEPARTTALESIRVGPEALVDTLPDGRQRPARRALVGGDDLVATISDDTYIGVDDTEPLKRTGLFSLRNEEEISIVACPGRTSAALQAALIEHCELMRYRFAVLDAQRSPNDSLNDVQAQRQQFDTKYAAIYHPWTLIPEPFPANLATVMDYAVPPSGHVMGIYARTDNERGVHKAPANEVVRGVIGLQRILNKGEQDILNPFPVNINVIRDFRPNDRGIRVWGGRVITSDPDWKYVNVRRLLIFIEASIDRGLQWVVFEPNAEPLWARVNRTVSNFLSSVWRDGALEGTKPEEAYFVKVDRTTMTQTDIDNGRLIVVIGVAPVKPAEFVIIRIGLWTAHAET